MSLATKSDCLKNEGNRIYRLFSQKSSRSLRISFLRAAIRFYEEAKAEATSAEQTSSLHKNLAAAQFSLVRELSTGKEENLEVFYMKESFENILAALKTGVDAKPTEWLRFMANKLVENIDEYSGLIAGNSFAKRAEKLARLVDFSWSRDLVVNVYVHYLVCQAYHRGSIVAASEDFKQSVRLIKECYFHQQECERLLVKLNNKLGEGDATDLLTEAVGNVMSVEKLAELSQDVRVQECVAEAHQMKHIADGVYHEALNSAESLDIELIWNAVDDYKSAIINAHDRDIEVEAECTSKMATVLEKILGLGELARTYHYNCLALAESMKPKTFYACTWFAKSTAAVKRYQKETLDEEERAKAEKRKGVSHKIKPAIDEINKKFKELSKDKFLEFIYEKYPPKNGQHKLDETLMASNLKKCLRNAATHYHTDKNAEETYGLEWFFVCEETVKLINKHYESLKGEE